MAIVQVSFDSENKVMEYTALPTNSKSGYPSTCGKGSRLAVLNAVSGKLSSEFMYDGVDWQYIQKNLTLDDLVLYDVIHEATNAFTIDCADRVVKNVELAITNTTGKTVSVANVPRDCKLTLWMVFTGTATVTWFSGITWSGSQPSWASGHTYKVEMITKDGGSHWSASAISW